MIDLNDVLLSLRMTQPLLSDLSEGDEYVLPILGEIYLQGEDGGRCEKLGTLKGYRVAITEMGEDGRLHEGFDIMDSIDSDMERMGSHIFDVDGVSEDFQGQFEPYFSDILILSLVEVTESHRGKGIGLAAVNRFIRMLGKGCGPVLLQPFPLQFAGKVNDSTRTAFDAAQQKIAAYWRRLGFEYLTGQSHLPSQSQIMGLDLSLTR